MLGIHRLYGRRHSSSANIDSLEASPFIETCAFPKIERIQVRSHIVIDTATQKGIAITLSLFCDTIVQRDRSHAPGCVLGASLTYLMHIDALILKSQVCDIKLVGTCTCDELS